MALITSLPVATEAIEAALSRVICAGWELDCATAVTTMKPGNQSRFINAHLGDDADVAVLAGRHPFPVVTAAFEISGIGGRPIVGDARNTRHEQQSMIA